MFPRSDHWYLRPSGADYSRPDGHPLLPHCARQILCRFYHQVRSVGCSGGLVPASMLLAIRVAIDVHGRQIFSLQYSCDLLHKRSADSKQTQAPFLLFHVFLCESWRKKLRSNKLWPHANNSYNNCDCTHKSLCWCCPFVCLFIYLFPGVLAFKGWLGMHLHRARKLWWRGWLVGPRCRCGFSSHEISTLVVPDGYQACCICQHARSLISIRVWCIFSAR